WGGHYTVSLTSGITSAVGQPLTPVAYSFDVAAPSWSTPVQLAVSTFTAGTPVVAFDSSGHAFGVWMQDTDGVGTWNVHAARFDVSTATWKPALQLDGGSGASNPQVAFDASGNAIAVWEQASAGAVAQIAVARWSPSSGQWGAPQLVQTSTLRGSNPQL